MSSLMRTYSRFMRFACLVSVASFALACGEPSAEIGDPGAPTTDPGLPTTDPGAPSAEPTAPGTTASPGSPTVTIRAKGTTAPYAHTDGFSGATALRQIVGVKSLHLFRSESDPAPLEVFDHGTKAVEVDYVTGDATVLAKVPLSSIPGGVYRLAPIGVAYVRYSVAARMHNGLVVDGRYDNVQALSKGAVIDGVARGKGYHRYAFSAYGTTYGVLEGNDAPVPANLKTGGVELDTKGDVSFYVFPVDVAVDPTVTVDQDVLFEANVDKAFRWQDQLALGFTGGVFDTTVGAFEPVMAFGANSFSVAFSRLP
jgi:hypothetical protein